MDSIMIKNLNKGFKIYSDKGSTLKEKIIFSGRRSFDFREVLKDISLTIKKGDAVGLIGENGSGKSTLLKLMTRIIYPNSGSIVTNGRISSLIELGAGFHPDLSGRENIYTNASIFGLNKKEIDGRLAQIIDFSELWEFIDNPVRTYSSGMYMRLAFSVAINVDADILLIDEILAVGDTNFQAKCFEKLRELKAEGVTIVIVTHDTATIERFCDRAVWIDEGKIAYDGIPGEAVDEYLRYMGEKRIDGVNKKRKMANNKEILHEDESENVDIFVENVDNSVENSGKPKEISLVSAIDTTGKRFGLKYIEITKACIKDAEGVETYALKNNEEYVIEIYYKVNKSLEEYVFGVGFYTLEGLNIYGNNTQLDRIKVSKCTDKGVVKYRIKKLPLLSGTYILNVAVVDMDGTPMDFFREYCKFAVISEDKSVGVLAVEHSWEV